MVGHIIKLQNFAEKYNCIIGIRFVDPTATDLIKDGNPTKGFNIKGKSADWGPQAGCICVNQALSKLSGAPEEKKYKFNKEVQSCLLKGYAEALPLTITENRLKLLIEKGIVYELRKDDFSASIKLKAKTRENVVHEFTLDLCDKEPKEYWVNYNGAPVEVLCKDNKPITADYDLLLVAVPLEDFGPDHILPVKDVSHVVFKNRIDGYQYRSGGYKNLEKSLKEIYLDPNKFYKEEKENLGNVTPFLSKFIYNANEYTVGKGNKVFHHNTDAGSPATDMTANFPATFVLPRTIGPFDTICVIKNKGELNTLVQEAKNAGFYVPLNPLWKETKTIRSKSFKCASDILANAFKTTA